MNRYFAKTVQTIYNLQVKNLIAKYRTNELNDEQTANEVKKIAFHAWSDFNGLLSDYRLEEILLEIGLRNIIIAERKNLSQQRRILHVVTSIWSIGGHSRIVLDWIRYDEQSEHFIFLTDQHEIPQEIAEQLKNTEIFFASKTGLIPNAQQLQDISNGYDLVILHHHPHDVVPVIAFAHPSKTPVIVYNHADHVFWLGTTVADVIVDFRVTELTEKYRHNAKSYILPFIAKESEYFDKSKLKMDLGLPNDSIVLISIGAKYKFLPHKYNYIKDIFIPVLKANKNVYLYLIGPDYDFVQNFISKEIPFNLRPMGYLSSPDKYLKAADIYIESAPIGSGVATVEMLNYGAIPLFSKCYAIEVGKTNGSGSFPSSNMNEIIPQSVRKYQEIFCNLISNQDYRTHFKNICDNSICLFSIKDWKERVENLYAIAISSTHQPKVIQKLLYCEKSKDYIEFSNSKKHRFLFLNDPYYEMYSPLYNIRLGVVKIIQMNLWFLFSPKLYGSYMSLFILNKKNIKKFVKGTFKIHSVK